MSKIAITITTMFRENLLEQCIASILKYRPKDSIILIADQGQKEIDIKKKDYYENLGCYFYTLPFDSGLSYARNILVQRAKEMGCEYCIIASDSMMFTEKTKDLHTFIQFMDKYDCIGFHLANANIYWVGWLTLIPEKCFQLDFIDRSTWPYDINNVVLDCNIVHNFFIAKTETLRTIKWDESLKLAEHEDFFYRYAQAGYKVGWTPLISCDYIKSRDGECGRYRNENWQKGLQTLYKKYGIKGWINYENIHLGKWGI